MQYKGLAFKSALDSQLPLLLIFAEREAKIAFRKQKGLFEREAEPLQKQKGFNGVQQIQMKSLYKADNKQKVLLNQVRISLKTILYASLSLRCLALMTLAKGRLLRHLSRKGYENFYSHGHFAAFAVVVPFPHFQCSVGNFLLPEIFFSLSSIKQPLSATFKAQRIEMLNRAVRKIR